MSRNKNKKGGIKLARSSLQKRIGNYDQGLVPLINTKGRRFKENNEYFHSLGEFDRDYYKILKSKVLQGITFKTQLQLMNSFGCPINPHISNRRTHIDLTVIISAIIARELGLNVRLCEAIALGHDVGHAPYSHNGERYLGTNHAWMSATMLQLIERGGKGLNLTWEVLNGIINHSRNNEELYLEKNQPNEVSVVVIADKLAYLFLDIEELVACEPNWVDFESISKMAERLGKTRTERTNACINALIKESIEKGRVSFSKSREAQIFRILRDRMNKEYYKVIDFREERLYQVENLKIVLDFFRSGNLCENLTPELVVNMLIDDEVDWLANMLRNRKPTEKDFQQILKLSAVKIVKSLKGKEINHNTNPLWEIVESVI